MRALECAAPRSLQVSTRAMPTPGPDDVLVRIRRVGICGTDFHIYGGNQPFVTYPRVLGHELAGEVQSAPEGTSLKPGERVCIVPYLACGSCIACRRGKPNCCVNIAVLGVHQDGGLTDFVSVPKQNVLAADGLDFDALAMVEFLAIGRHAVRRANISAGQRALVVGAGPIGLAVSLFARLAGAEVIAVDGRADRLAFCRDVLGIGQTAAPDDVLEETLSVLTNGEFFDVVFDATGNRGAMEKGFSYVAHGGAYVLVSIVQGDIAFNDANFHKRETSLLGSRNATADDFRDVLTAMQKGLVPLGAFNTHRAHIDDLPHVLPQWTRPESGVIKALVEL